MARVTIIFGLFFFYVHSVAALELQGSAMYEYLKEELYLAQVHAQDPSADVWIQAGSPLKLEMMVVTDRVSPRMFRRIWTNDIAVNITTEANRVHSESIEGYARLLQGELISGDTIVVSNEQGRTDISINGVDMMKVDDPAFANLLVMAWVGPYPNMKTFKQELIGSGVSAQPVRHMNFEGSGYSQERVVEIEKWKAKKEKIMEGVALVLESAVDLNEPSLQSSQLEARPDAVEEKIQQEAQRLAQLEVERILQQQAEDELLKQQQLAEKIQQDNARLELEKQQEEIERLKQKEETERIAAIQKAEDDYYVQVTEQVHAAAAQMLGSQKGQVRVDFMINRQGEVQSVDVGESSKVFELDKAARAAVKRASPYPPVPDLIAGDEFDFEIHFSIR